MGFFILRRIVKGAQRYAVTERVRVPSEFPAPIVTPSCPHLQRPGNVMRMQAFARSWDVVFCRCGLFCDNGQNIFYA